jgi:hypothetical protein
MKWLVLIAIASCTDVAAKKDQPDAMVLDTG